MTERTIRLADGTEIEDCDLAYDGSLWFVCPVTIREAADLFLDESKTERILYARHDIAEVFTGFVDVQLLNVVPGGVRILLTGTDTEHTTEPIQEGSDA